MAELQDTFYGSFLELILIGIVFLKGDNIICNLIHFIQPKLWKKRRFTAAQGWIKKGDFFVSSPPYPPPSPPTNTKVCIKFLVSCFLGFSFRKDGTHTLSIKHSIFKTFLIEVIRSAQSTFFLTRRPLELLKWRTYLQKRR